MNLSWLAGLFLALQWTASALGVIESPTATVLEGRVLHLHVEDSKLEFHLRPASHLFEPDFSIVAVDSLGNHEEIPFDTTRFFQGATESGHSGIFRIHDGVLHSATVLTDGDLWSLEHKEGKLNLKKFSELDDHELMGREPWKECHFQKDPEAEERSIVAVKRQTKASASCSLQLVADSKFCARFSTPEAVSNYMTTVFGGMSTIYAGNFPGKMTMTLAGIKMYPDAATDPYLNVGGGQDEYLNLLNKVQSNIVSGAEKQACIVHLFTHRNLQGTMGLAFVGGICSPQNRGRNCGMTSTMYIDGSSSSILRHTASFSHECGHNFGSSHDGDQASRPECNPANAPYLMFFSTLSAAGSRNQFTFSPCSMENMTTPVRTCFNVDIAAMARTVPVQFAYSTAQQSSTGPSTAVKVGGVIAGVVIAVVAVAVVAGVVAWKIRQRRQVV